jgi:branched-chain amino acid transport system substrate-binding protein
VYVFADAFARAQSFEPERVRDAISETDLDTFFGHIKFDSQGVNSEKSVMLTQIIDGDYVLIAPHGWAEREPVIAKPEITDPTP